MTGLRKSAKIKCLSGLYEKENIEYDMRDLYNLTTSQLKKRIKELK